MNNFQDLKYQHNKKCSSSDKIDKYEYLTDKWILPSNQSRVTEQA